MPIQAPCQPLSQPPVACYPTSVHCQPPPGVGWGAQANRTGKQGPGLPGMRAPVCPAQCQRGVSQGSCLCRAGPHPRGRPHHSHRMCLSRSSALWPGSIPQSLSKSLPQKVQSCLLACFSGGACVGQTGRGMRLPGVEGGTATPAPTQRHSSAYSPADSVGR